MQHEHLQFWDVSAGSAGSDGGGAGDAGGGGDGVHGSAEIPSSSKSSVSCGHVHDMAFIAYSRS